MDELLIEEKKYVSSKRAAKVTGYAKDYIGQLCREGRVPARLIGRSWYVLETAIKDHRFGATNLQPEEKAPSTTPEKTISSTWESPRYESPAEDFLPPINRLRVDTGHGEENGEELKASEHLQDAWKTWFDRVADTGTAIPTIEKPEITQKVEEKSVEEEGEVRIPIHTLYEMPAEEFTPPQEVFIATEQMSKSEAQGTRYVDQRGKRAWMRAIQVSSILFATIMVAVAVIGSGYVDEYIISNSQVRIISGIGLYNK